MNRILLLTVCLTFLLAVIPITSVSTAAELNSPDSTINTLKVAIKENNIDLFTSCFVIKKYGEWFYNAIVSKGNSGSESDEGYEHWIKFFINNPPQTDDDSKYVLNSKSFGEYHYRFDTWEEAMKSYELNPGDYAKELTLSYRGVHWTKLEGKWLIVDM